MILTGSLALLLITVFSTVISKKNILKIKYENLRDFAFELSNQMNNQLIANIAVA